MHARTSTAGPTEAGSTLIEVLVATVVMSSAIIVLVAGLVTIGSSSIQNRQTTNASIVARDYAEALDLAVAGAGAWCGNAYAVTSAVPSGYSVSAAYGACPANTATTPQFQTVVITATAPNGATETLRTVVRQS